MNITILNADVAEKEMLDACIAKAINFGDADVTIEVRERVPLDAAPWRNPGWLEYAIYYKLLSVHAIQRRPGAEVEFHS